LTWCSECCRQLSSIVDGVTSDYSNRHIQLIRLFPVCFIFNDIRIIVHIKIHGRGNNFSVGGAKIGEKESRQ